MGIIRIAGFFFLLGRCTIKVLLGIIKFPLLGRNNIEVVDMVDGTPVLMGIHSCNVGWKENVLFLRSKIDSGNKNGSLSGLDLLVSWDFIRL